MLQFPYIKVIGLMNFHTNKIGQQILILTILIAAYLLPRAGAIAKFVAVDEVNWLHRSGLFYDF